MSAGQFLSGKKAERELGWSAQIDFLQGLQTTIDWYRTHPDWVACIKTGAYRDFYEQQYGDRLQPQRGSE